MRALRRTLAVLLPTVAFGLAALMVVPGVFGYERYVITSGSMTGAYDRGSVVFDEIVPVASLRAGDVITFAAPVPPHELVTHRIASIRADRDGRPAITTRGDANPIADAWTLTPNAPRITRVAGSIPKIGYVLAALTLPTVRLLGIALPAGLIALLLLAGLWRERHRGPPAARAGATP